MKTNILIADFKETKIITSNTRQRYAYLYADMNIDQLGYLTFSDFKIVQYDEYHYVISQPYQDTIEYFKPIIESLLTKSINISGGINNLVQKTAYKIYKDVI